MLVDLTYLAFLIKKNKKYLIFHFRERKFNKLSDKQFLYLILIKLSESGNCEYNLITFNNYNCSLKFAQRMDQLILAKCLGFVS